MSHTCDNPPCCNPNHLVAETQQKNTQDGVARGRHPYGKSERYRETRGFRGPRARGERNGAARLTNAEVSEMRELRNQGMKLKDIAARFDTTAQYTWSIVNFKVRKENS